ncbi:MAG TPA: cation diffusion facilitator family transporter [Acidimicrobiales bacterium]|nr:cation diffusion facilitator family transporter [Acidimicrobiales bacterium]
MHVLSAPELARQEDLSVAVAGHDEEADRRLARRAVLVSAAVLSLTGGAELAAALACGSVGLLGDALHNLADVSTSAVVLFGFWLSRRPPSPTHPYGYERAEDLAGLGVALVVWASAALAGAESWHKLVGQRPTTHLGWAMAGAALGAAGNQLVARYKLAAGRRIQSLTLVAEARHSWLDVLSSLGALAGLVAVALGHPLGDPVAGFAVTAFICRVGYDVTARLVQHLMDAVGPEVVPAAEAAASRVPGVAHAHASARWAGRSLVVEVEAWLDPALRLDQAQATAWPVARAVAEALPAVRRVSFHPRPYLAPAGPAGDRPLCGGLGGG